MDCARPNQIRNGSEKIFSQWQKKRVYFYLIAILLAAFPVLATSYVPALDAASHEGIALSLNRILISGLGSPFYGLDTLFLPNGGFYLPGLIMATWMSPEMVGRIFLGATIALTFSGVLVLGRVATGYWDDVRLASGVLLYNLFVILGFFSYELGVALILWAIAGRLLLDRAPAYARLVIGSTFAILPMLCHASAFGVYAVVLAGFGLDRLIKYPRQLVRVILMGAETLPAVACFVLMSTGGQGRVHYDHPFWQAKIFDAIKSVSSGSEIGDIAFVAGAAAVAALLAACGRARIQRSFVIVLAMLTVLYFIIPPHTFGGSYVDTRVPVVILLIGLSAVEFKIRHSNMALALIVIAGGAYVTKQLALSQLWYQEGRTLTHFAQVFAELPDGSVLLQAECTPNANDVSRVYASRQPPLTHVAAIAGFTGNHFAAVTWTLKGQQPVYTLPRYQPYQSLQSELGVEVCTARQYQDSLERARRVADAQQRTGVVAPRVYLMLLRPSVASTLSQFAPLEARTPDMEIYRVN